MHSLAIIIINTPWWVWLVFVYILIMGLHAAKRRVIFLPMLFTLPIIFVALFYYRLSLDSTLIIYSASFLLSCLIGFSWGIQTRIKILKEQYSIEIPGSYQILILSLCLFITKYFFGFIRATNPDLSQKYLVIESTLAAFFGGYFLGRSLAFVYKFLKYKQSTPS